MTDAPPGASKTSDFLSGVLAAIRAGRAKLQTFDRQTAYAIAPAIAVVVLLLLGAVFSGWLHRSPPVSEFLGTDPASAIKAVAPCNLLDACWVNRFGAVRFAAILATVTFLAELLLLLFFLSRLLRFVSVRAAVMIGAAGVLIGLLRVPSLLTTYGIENPLYCALAKAHGIGIAISECDNSYVTPWPWTGLLAGLVVFIWIALICVLASRWPAAGWQDPARLRLRQDTFILSTILMMVFVSIGVARNYTSHLVISNFLEEPDQFVRTAQVINVTYAIYVSAMFLTISAPAFYGIHRDIDAAAALVAGSSGGAEAWRKAHGLQLSIFTAAGPVLAAALPILSAPLTEYLKRLFV